jgi:hypothetical protein
MEMLMKKLRKCIKGNRSNVFAILKKIAQKFRVKNLGGM